MSPEDQPYGLMFRASVPAGEVLEGQIVVLNGHVVGVEPDPADLERVRLTVVPALGPPPGKRPDQRPIEIACPRDMVLGTAEPHNIDLAPPPTGI